MKNKKIGILPIISIIFAVILILTWIVKTGTIGESGFVLGTGTSPLGFIDIFRTPVSTIVNFSHIIVFILLIGGFYGVVNETGVYEKVVSFVEKKLKKKTLIITMISLIVLTSMVGINMLLLVIVPFLATVLLKIGYDNKTVLAATIGSILIGNIGAVYSSYVNTPVKYYLNLDVNSLIIFKLILLVVISALFILFVTSKATIKKVAKKDLEIPLYNPVTEKKKSPLSLVLISVIAFVFLAVAMYDWVFTLDITLFQDMRETVRSLAVFDYPIVANLMGNTTEMGRFTMYDLSIFLVMLSILISWIYSIKFTKAFDAFVEGAKKMAKPAFYAAIANIVFVAIQVTQGNENIFYTLMESILTISEGFNIILSSIAVFIGGIFYIDFGQFAQVFTGIANATGVTNLPGQLALIMQTFHGILMMILPTSVLLIVGLSYFGVSFIEWVKYIWKYLLQITAISLIISILANLII